MIVSQFHDYVHFIYSRHTQHMSCFSLLLFHQFVSLPGDPVVRLRGQGKTDRVVPEPNKWHSSQKSSEGRLEL